MAFRLACLFGLVLAAEPASRAAGMDFARSAGMLSIGDFDLPGGSAERTLDRFAQQSGIQLIYPTEEVRHVRTNPVQGRFTPREALERLLAGTPLVAQFDGFNGLAAIALARGSGSNEIVALPPYVVDARPLSWHYAQVGKFEVLSAGTEEATKRAIEQIHRLHEALALLLPEELQGAPAVPELYVLHSDRSQVVVSEELMAEFRRLEGLGMGRDGASSTGWLKHNHGFWDYDGYVVYLKIDEEGFFSGKLGLSPDYVRHVLERRMVGMPPWLVEGMLELYQSAELDPYGVRVTAFSANPQALRRPGGVVRLESTQGLISALGGEGSGRRFTVGLLPLAEIFEADPPPPGDPRRARWQAQSALFLRWALDGGSRSSRWPLLWELVQQAGEKPVTEAGFRKIFRLGYAQTETEMRRYLVRSQRQAVEVRPARFESPPRYELRRAGDLEVGWVKGDLDRLKMRYVRQHFPTLTAHYMAQTRDALEQARLQAPDDPRVLGLLGLFACDAGDDDEAAPLLAAAVAGGLARPRVYWELARIRIQELKFRPDAGPAETAKLAEIVGLLDSVRALAPAQLMGYELLAEVWQWHAITLSRTQLAVLQEGLRYFPRRLSLIAAVARLHARHGYQAEAQAILAHALQMATDEASREQLLSLREEIHLYAGRMDRARLAYGAAP